MTVPSSLPVVPAALRSAVVEAVSRALADNRDRGNRLAAAAVADAALAAAAGALAGADGTAPAAAALLAAANA